MVYSTRTIERVSIVAAILGLVQGSVWFLWGLFSIFTYYDILHLNFEAQSIPYFMFRIFVGENDRTIIIFMFLYAVLSLMLCVFSALIIKETLQAESPTLVLLVYVSWSVNMVILSLVDIVLTCFLGRDLSDLFYQPETPAENLIDAYTIILLVSMRGVILWIINIMFAGYIIIFGFQFSRSGFSRSDDIINAFEESSGPWHTNLSNNPLARISRKESWKVGGKTTNSYQNLIVDDNLTVNSEMFKKQENYEERLANIGKPGRRTPLKASSPVNVPPPVPPLLFNEILNDQPGAVAYEKSENDAICEEIENIFDGSSMKDESNGTDYPHIPSPDYSPIGSPVLNNKLKMQTDQNSGSKFTMF